MRTVNLSVLDSVRIASPCPVTWESMQGDQRQRHCDQCDLKVFNISDMTRAEAEAFLTQAAGAGGRVCAGFWQRADGTILTKDCPVGLAAVRAAIGRKAARVAAVVGLVFSGLVAMGMRGRSEESKLRAMEPFSGIARVLNPVAPFLGPMARPRRAFLLGAMCVTPLTPQAPAANQAR